MRNLKRTTPKLLLAWFIAYLCFSAVGNFTHLTWEYLNVLNWAEEIRSLYALVCLLVIPPIVQEWDW